MAAEDAITFNETLRHFEYTENGLMAFIEYRMHHNSIVFVHTIVPEALSGKGVAASLAAYAFNYAKENNLPVIVFCSYITHYLKKHPELTVQLDKTYHLNP